ncbi:hypothetical protein GCM10023100_28590 [Actinocorallia cavernae]|uniref:Uncharacterized protein n=2 Tax=Actinomycetes TaxID=1760 RepID=A0ABP5Y3F9_9ACTN
MLGHLGVVEVALHPACVEPDQQAAQFVAQVHVALRGFGAGYVAGPVEPTAARALVRPCYGGGEGGGAGSGLRSSL